MVAGCDGRPHTRLCVDSRRDHGGSGSLSYRASLSADAGRRAGRRHDDGPDSRHLGGRIYGRLCRADCRGAKRHQAHPGLLDRLATRLHDGRPRHGRRGRGYVPPDNSCFFQGALIHGRGLGDSRLPRRAGYSQNGRTESRYAADVCDLRGRHVGAMRISAAVFRLLEQGRHSGSCTALERCQNSVLYAGLWRVADGVLHDPASSLRLLWLLAGRQTRARESRGDDRAAGDSGILRHGVGIDWNSRLAVVQSVSGWSRGELRVARVYGAWTVSADVRLDSCCLSRSRAGMEAIR